jgi:hypothetical protein
MLSRNEPEDRYFIKEEPDPPNQILKLFSESYIAQRKGNLPSQHSVCHNLSCFIGEWEKKTCRKLPNNVKDDVYNVCAPLHPSNGFELTELDIQSIFGLN